MRARLSTRVMTAASSAAPRSDSGGEEHERCMAAVESALEYCPRVAQLRQAPRPPLRVARPLPLLLCLPVSLSPPASLAPTVSRWRLQALQKLGRDVPVSCMRCPDPEAGKTAAAGGFMPDTGTIVMCQQWAAEQPGEVAWHRLETQRSLPMPEIGRACDCRRARRLSARPPPLCPCETPSTGRPGAKHGGARDDPRVRRRARAPRLDQPRPPCLHRDPRRQPLGRLLLLARGEPRKHLAAACRKGERAATSRAKLG